MMEQTYSPQPLPGSAFGMEVRDFSLTQPMEPEVIDRIKADVAECASASCAWCDDSRNTVVTHKPPASIAAQKLKSGQILCTGTRLWSSETKASSAERIRWAWAEHIWVSYICACRCADYSDCSPWVL